jgi:hypothetical protein
MVERPTTVRSTTDGLVELPGRFRLRALSELKMWKKECRSAVYRRLLKLSLEEFRLI